MAENRVGHFTWAQTPPVRRRPLRNLMMLVVVSTAVGVISAALMLPWTTAAGIGAREASRFYQSLPAGIEEPPLPQRSTLLDANGRRFAQLITYDRIPVPSSKMSPLLRAATVAVEDSRFFEHNGYDPVGIARAVASNAGSEAGLQGASTITQQYVKNVLVLSAELGADEEAAHDGADVSVLRKLREVKLAIATEQAYDKDEILTRYLNIAYFGNGAYGVEAASRRYFSRSAADLTIPQVATLVTLLKNPTGYDPLKYPDTAASRRSLVIDVLASRGVITPEQATKAREAKLGLRPSKPVHGCAASKWPFYCAQVLSILTNDPAFGADAHERSKLLTAGGLRVRTALDPAAMRAANQAAASVVPPEHRVAAGVAVIEPGTGHVAAIGTNRRFGSGALDRTEIVLPTRAEFQPGSTFKTFTLAAAFDQGIALETKLPGGASYTSRTLANPPKGYYSNSAGSMAWPTLTQATQMSMNTAFVQLEEKVGVRAIAEMAQRLGVTSVTATGPGAPGDRDGSYTLGTAAVSVTDIANGYASLAARGVACRPTFITAVKTARGQRIAPPDAGCTQVLDRAAADTTAHVLGQVVASGTGKPAAFGRPAAGKTGTAENMGAAWFAGFTPQYATAVWVGDPRGATAYPLVNVLGYSRVYGGTLPASIWKRTMADLHAGLPVRKLPPPDPSYVVTASGNLVPAVHGLSAAEAATRLRFAGLRVSRKVHKVAARPGQLPGVVVAQKPAPGERATGQKVTLTVTR